MFRVLEARAAHCKPPSPEVSLKSHNTPNTEMDENRGLKDNQYYSFRAPIILL